MLTRYQVLRTDGSVFDGSVNWPEQPTRHVVNTLVRRFCMGDFACIRLDEYGEQRDMFVLRAENARLRTGDVNLGASALYRENLLRQRPQLDPLVSPPVVGPAVVFARVVTSRGS